MEQVITNNIETNEIFDEISGYYDKVNNLISFGMHKFIKNSAVKLLEIKPDSKCLDLCTGSGDILGLILKNQPNCEVIGVDKSDEMLKIASSKFKGGKYIQADCRNLPFNDNEFDYAAISFGLRNVVEYKKAISEIYRVLKPNGLLLHLDFGYHNFLNKIFDMFLIFLIKILKINSKSYEYLIKSKNIFPEPDKLIKEFEQNGFSLVKQRNWFLGAISAQVMRKM